VPSASEDPLARSRFPCGIGNHLNDVVPGARGRQLQVSRRLAHAGEVHVRVDKAGRRKRSFQVDEARAGADVRLNVALGTNRGDRVASYGERLDVGMPIVERDDAAAAQHEIGRGFGRGCLRARHEQNGNENGQRPRHELLRRPILPSVRSLPARPSRPS
jgi:hypothetical protein